MRSAVSTAERHLAEAGVPSPEFDARRLATFVLGVENLALISDVPADFEATYEALIQRRCGREPLQHIIGRVPFRHIDVLVEPGVFIPRPETELVAGAAIDEALTVASHRGSVAVVDLCTGTGAIAVSVASEVPQASVVAVDLSPAAIVLTQRNVALQGLTNLQTVDADIAADTALASLNGAVDVVVSNPPYVPSESVITDPEVLLYDPPLALYGGGEDGFALPRKVILAAQRLLRPGGLLVMEHDETQGEVSRTYAIELGFADVRTHQDLVGRDRFLVARKG